MGGLIVSEAVCITAYSVGFKIKNDSFKKIVVFSSFSSVINSIHFKILLLFPKGKFKKSEFENTNTHSENYSYTLIKTIKKYKIM